MTLPAPQIARPRLTFACELEPTRLTALFADGTVIETLAGLDAGVALMLSDLSDERAATVRKLNAAGIPVIGIPLLPLEDGYYFTADNIFLAVERYERWKVWTAQQGLIWAGVGLDIEPDAQVYLQIMDNLWGLVPMLLSRLTDRERLRRAESEYDLLVERIHSDGYAVENYQFPLIEDDRRAKSTLLRRLLGIVNVRTDREVWMLYTSVMPGNLGPRLLWTYAPEAPAIAVGTTGGGPDIPGHPQVPALDWKGFDRDLRLARYWSDDLYVHSLEGCVQQGFLERLRSFDWGRPVEAPEGTWAVGVLRRVLRVVLRAGEHPGMAIAVLGASLWLLSSGFRNKHASCILRGATNQRENPHKSGIHPMGVRTTPG